MIPAMMQTSHGPGLPNLSDGDDGIAIVSRMRSHAFTAAKMQEYYFASVFFAVKVPE